MEENNENKNVEAKGTENVQEKKKKSGIGLTIVLVILIIALAGGIGYLTKMFLDGKIENGANNNVTNESKIEGKKIDESKPWVYDAEYIKENKIAYGMFDGEASTSDEYLKVPTININSEYANKANEEIKEMYNKLYNSFGTKNKNNYTMAGELSYEWYELDNLLSIAIIRREGVTNAGWSKEYFIYNINLDTLEAATYEEIYKKCGFNSEGDVIENATIALDNLNIENQGGYEGTVIKYEQYFINEDGLNFLIPSPAGSLVPLSVKPKMVKVTSTNENNTGVTNKTDEKTTSQQDYSIFSEFKSLYYRNVDFDSTTPDNNEYCELKFDDEGIPTIKIGEKNIYNHECAFYTLEIKDIKSDVAAGTTYVTFNFNAWTPGGDTTGNATIRFSNVAENAILGVKANITFDGKNHEYSNKGDFINVTRENVTGKKFVNDFVAEEPYPTMYIYGRDFITFPGTVDRNTVYYINEDDELCVEKIGDNTIYIIAKNIVRLTREQSSNEIYAYTDDDFVESDIFEKDERVVYKKAE